MSYTKEDLVNKFNSIIEKNSWLGLYTDKILNYKGKTKDNEKYSDIVADLILNRIDELKSWKPQIKERLNSYKTKTHTFEYCVNHKKTNRIEEFEAVEIFLKSDYLSLGKIIDYQTPLKSSKSEPIGKVDLIAYDNKALRLLEFKREDSSETILRAVLESYTYKKVVDLHKEKFLKDFNLPNDTKIIACILVYENSQILDQLKDRKIKELIKQLEIEIFYINKKFEIKRG